MSRDINRYLSLAILAVLFPILMLAKATAVQAAERAIVVFDGSGSMWGQIRGKTKIEIAREVMKQSLPGWAERDVDMGLIAYGHRQKGACGDIEVLIPPKPLDVDQFSAALDSVSPKGKTPLTAAVRMAAEELRFTEEKATVILLSDGLETCDLDPCAVSRELEGLGVDFTAHVIGFDVAEPEERAQLSCIAENTGGLFVTASNAEELSTAFEQVAALKPGDLHRSRCGARKSGSRAGHLVNQRRQRCNQYGEQLRGTRRCGYPKRQLSGRGSGRTLQGRNDDRDWRCAQFSVPHRT